MSDIRASALQAVAAMFCIVAAHLQCGIPTTDSLQKCLAAACSNMAT
jgi:hypothetical protein